MPHAGKTRAGRSRLAGTQGETHRNEKTYLAANRNDDSAAAYPHNVDGVFTDFANSGYAARANYLRESVR
ncbi:glycerophosphoryl diester phosphodiesterase [Caballeronia insecticola]|uniref:Glycerophosphoryl diester phosphodiesterase n=1 Tax=Caballeronia insecticola TaxID=758793 RepID=R4WV75_9BURK|nr:glycerophosphoryl diester phosphodiesterase [Caballeronia insecticola]